MQKTLILGLIVAILSGCASLNKQPLDAKTAATLDKQTVIHTVRQKKPFAAMTASNVILTLPGVAIGVDEGNRIIAKNKIADPADAIAIGLAKALEVKYGTQLVAPAVAVDTADAAKISTAASTNAKFVIDVETINWRFIYFSTDWTRYGIIYVAKARLINTTTKSVIAEGHCKRVPESNTNAPTYDELMANEAAVLKRELGIAADECIKTLKAEMLAATV